MKTIKQLIETSPRTPIGIAPGDTVLAALKLMAEKGIGAVVVMDGDKLAGIFSERDYARKVVLFGKNSTDTKVAEVMTEKVFYVSPEHTVEQVMALMTDKRIRHMPVLDAQQRVLSLVSLGDMVKETIAEQAFKIEQLERYIAG
ncbi:MAG: CBS domain-containing protein [Rhodocyclaceae bacterium]|nr:CBS domain-containing protein [Rhodocyclaceae bacterium]MDZ4213992.1 CBS domain-containing protein [Rhodocyclaceae bacterium]